MNLVSISVRTALFFVLVAAGSFTLAQMPSEEDLLALPTEWHAHYNANELDALAMLYTEDATIMPPNAELAQGREAVQAIMRGYHEAGAVRIDVPPLETYEIFGDAAWGSGPYRLYDAEGEVVGVGTYLIVYRVNDGRWRVSRHMWNSDLPPAAAEE